MKSKNSRRTLYLTDGVIINVFERLVSDLAASISLEGQLLTSLHAAIHVCKTTGNAAQLRTVLENLIVPLNVDPYTVKVLAQIKGFLKRVRFRTDLYTDNDLTQRTQEKFLEVQNFLSVPHVLKETTKRVIDRARSIVTQALGPYDAEEHDSLCRFSTKACVGFPTPKSYLFNKFAGPLTGSHGHIEWFKQRHSEGDVLLSSVSYRVTDTLQYHQVPKSFKINRGITPNTLLGSYHSFGLGKMLEKRLKGIGIDVSRQPELHKKLAKSSSISRSLVTADLSSASDSFTEELVRSLCPPDWFEELNRGRIQNIRIGKTTYPLLSFMAMGIGFTFPLQTLLFYALIKATQELHGSYGFISVFGDDLLYPRRIHKFVVSILTDLKFRLNMDKTFVESNFRESCGGDFYRGVDVRPCSPEQDSKRLGKWQWIAFLHKLMNGLTLRWSEVEIPSVIYLLKKELSKFGPLMFIPDDLPDYSGIKRVTVDSFHFLTTTPEYNKKQQCLLYLCLIERAKPQYVPTLVGYYWEALKYGSATPNDQEVPHTSERRDSARVFSEFGIPRDLYSASREVVTLCSDSRTMRLFGVKTPKNYRSRLTRRRVRFAIPVVGSKTAPATMVVQQVISFIAT